MNKQSVYKQAEWDIKEAKNIIDRKAQIKINLKSTWRIRLFILFSSALGGTAIITNYENTLLVNELTSIKTQQELRLVPAIFSPFKIQNGSEDCSGLTLSIEDVSFCQPSNTIESI